jgi:tetratricopeptide (TPR) repeat protein
LTSLPAHLIAGADTTPPALRVLFPAAGAEITGDHLVVAFEYGDSETGIASETLRVLLNGKDYTARFDQHSRGATGRFTLPGPFLMGDNTIVIEIADRAGNVAHFDTRIVYREPSPAYNEGIELAAAKQWREAAAKFEHALRFDQNDSDAAVQLGLALLALNRHEDAAGALKRALDLKKEGQTYAALGTALAERGQWQEAAEAWDGWVEKEPDNALAHFRKAYALLAVRRYEQAEASLRECLRLMPEADGAYVNLGVALHGMGRYREAIAAFEQAVRLYSSLPETYYGLAMAYRAVGNDQAMRQQLNVLRELDPAMASDFDRLMRKHRAAGGKTR